MSRIILPAFTVLTFGFALFAHGDDALDRIRAKQAAAVQKLQADVKSGIERSHKVEARDAQFLMQNLLREVKDSRDLQESERAALVQQIQARLTQLNNAAREKQVRDDLKPLTVPPNKYKPVDPPSGGGGGGVSGVAKGFIDPAKKAADTTADAIREREKSIARINTSIEKSAIPTDKEITFPSWWAMKPKYGQQLTKQEQQVLKALNSTMTVDYSGEKFKAALEHLQDKSGLVLIFDEASVRDVMLDYDDVVKDFKIPKASVRTVLKKMLGDKGLTYIIKEGHIQVMTPKRASEHTVVRSYPVDDLIQPNQMAQMFGPFVAQAQMMQNAQQLINLIQMTVEPTYWQPSGPGQITFYPPTRSLIIRASAEMHYQMAFNTLFR